MAAQRDINLFIRDLLTTRQEWADRSGADVSELFNGPPPGLKAPTGAAVIGDIGELLARREHLVRLNDPKEA